MEATEKGSNIFEVLKVIINLEFCTKRKTIYKGEIKAFVERGRVGERERERKDY